MSGSIQYNVVALVSLNDWGIIGGMINRNILKVDFDERQVMLKETQRVLRLVTWYTERVSTIQRVCNPLTQIIALQQEITELKSPQFLPP